MSADILDHIENLPTQNGDVKRMVQNIASLGTYTQFEGTVPLAPGTIGMTWRRALGDSSNYIEFDCFRDSPDKFALNAFVRPYNGFSSHEFDSPNNILPATLILNFNGQLRSSKGRSFDRPNSVNFIGVGGEILSGEKDNLLQKQNLVRYLGLSGNSILGLNNGGWDSGEMYKNVPWVKEFRNLIDPEGVSNIIFELCARGGNIDDLTWVLSQSMDDRSQMAVVLANLESGVHYNNVLNLYLREYAKHLGGDVEALMYPEKQFGITRDKILPNQIFADAMMQSISPHLDSGRGLRSMDTSGINTSNRKSMGGIRSIRDASISNSPSDPNMYRN